MTIPSGAGALLAWVMIACALGRPSLAAETVHIENASRPTRCAEEDNVYVKLAAPGIAHFTVAASHPAYLSGLAADSMAPDFSDCAPAHDPSYSFSPRDVTLYEDAHYRLLGHTLASFWRPEIVPFAVGEEVTPGLQLVQLFRKVGDRWIEFLVIYPSDGYWRLRLLPPPRFPETGYGSSFLVGPIREDGRPYVPIKSIHFDPKNVAFHLTFAKGQATVRVTEISAVRAALWVTLDPASGSQPFAALRSMFVSPLKADTAEVRIPGAPAKPILEFGTADAASVSFARSTPSRHNASAPDMTFGDFGR